MASHTTPVGRTTTADPYSRIAAMDRLIELSQARFMGKASPAACCRRETNRAQCEAQSADESPQKATEQEVLPEDLRTSGPGTHQTYALPAQPRLESGGLSAALGRPLESVRGGPVRPNSDITGVTPIFLGRRMVVTSGHRTARHIEPARPAQDVTSRQGI